MIGITAYAPYIPRLRLERAKIAAAWGTSQAAGEIAVANYDEDALTMAVEAAHACCDDGSHAQIDAFYFASTSSPYREKQIASLAAAACDVPRRCQTADFGGSTRAGVSALIAALHALRAGGVHDVIVAAADARVAQPESEMEGVFGDAAAAVRLGSSNVIAEIVDVASISDEFTYLWRTDEQRFVQAFPGKFSTTYGYAKDLDEAIRALLERNRLQPKAISKLALGTADARAAGDLAKQLGFDPKQQLVTPPIQAVGSAGTADALLALIAALDAAAAGDLLLVGAYGEGADVLLVRATDAIAQRRGQASYEQALAARLPLPSYQKYLKFRRVIELDEPGEAINNVLEFKELKQDLRLYGTRCGACGMVQYPQARVCIQCKGRDRLSDTKLSKRGTVFTFTIDHLIANLEHPLPMAVIDLEGGGRVYLQVTDFTEDEVQVGKSMQLTYRRLHEGGGNHNYFWKARPPR